MDSTTAFLSFGVLLWLAACAFIWWVVYCGNHGINTTPRLIVKVIAYLKSKDQTPHMGSDQSGYVFAAVCICGAIVLALLVVNGLFSAGHYSVISGVATP
jgi:hypothetical protein